MKNKLELDYFDKEAIEFCIEIIQELRKTFEKFDLNYDQMLTLNKALEMLSSYPTKKYTGYVELSSSVSWPEGGLDYFSIIIADEYLEIKKGGAVYNKGVGSDTLPEQILYSSEEEIDEEMFDLEGYKEIFLEYAEGNLRISNVLTSNDSYIYKS